MERINNWDSESTDILGWVIFAGLWALTATFVALIMHFYPDVIPFQFFEFWNKKDILGGIYASWPIFVWGAGATFVLRLFFPSDSSDKNRSYPWNILRSFFAGLLEETTYRWVFFFSFIVVVAVFDPITFGFLHWLYIHIEIPVINFVTLGKVEWVFQWKDSWIVGSAAIWTTASFRNAHKHLGLVSWINAWFLGWFFLYILVNYGIIAAIASHIVYDIIIFTVAYIQDAIVDR